MAAAVRIICCAASLAPVLSTSVPTRVVLGRDGEIQPQALVRAERNSVVVRPEDVAASLVNSAHKKEDICDELSNTEDGVDQLDDLSDGKVDGYLQVLSQWRHIFLERGLAQPNCRQRHLGEMLCRARNTSDKMARSEWEKRSQDLLSFESQLGDCNNVADRVSFDKWQRWTPEVFGNAPAKMADMSLILGSGEYDRVYAAGGHLAAPYGPDGAPMIPVGGKGQIRKERADHLNLLHIVRKAVPSMDLPNITQVLQFGGGSGDVAAMLFDMGFTGTHLVVDTEPMLLMQLFWLRLGGIPAFLGEKLLPTPNAVHKRIVLDSMDRMLKSHLDLSDAAAAQSLFWGVGSFMQAPESLRNELRPSLKKFGLIYLVFCRNGPECPGNHTDYISRWVDKDLSRTHNILAWAGDSKSIYFLALRKNRGNVTCLKELGCTNKTMLAVEPQLHNAAQVKSSLSSVFSMLFRVRLPTWRTDGLFLSLVLAGTSLLGVCALAATPKKDRKFVSGQVHFTERLPLLRRFLSRRAAAGHHRPATQTRPPPAGGLA